MYNVNGMLNHEGTFYIILNFHISFSIDIESEGEKDVKREREEEER